LAATRKGRGATNRKAADERAKQLASLVRELRKTGIVSLKNIADALNKRKVKTVYGARWHPTTVARLLGRLESSKGRGKAIGRRL
jgi:Recombinase